MGLLRREPARGMGCGCFQQGIATFSHGGVSETEEGYDQDMAAAGGGSVV